MHRLGRRARVYLVTGRKLLSQEGVNTFSVSLDGTRMGQREMLYAALYSADLGKALWCPPQDRRDEMQKRANRNRPHETALHILFVPHVAVFCRFVFVLCRFLPVSAGTQCMLFLLWLAVSGLPELHFGAFQVGEAVGARGWGSGGEAVGARVFLWHALRLERLQAIGGPCGARWLFSWVHVFLFCPCVFGQ